MVAGRVYQTDAKGKTIGYLYDALNRNYFKDYPSGSDVTFIYDQPSSSNSKGRLSTMIDGSGQTVYNYDSVGRIKSSTKTIAGVSYPMTTFGYVNARLDNITYPDNEIVTYGYDGAGNMKSAGGYVTYSDFNALGQPKKATFGNGVVTTYQYYTTNSRLESINSVKGGNNLPSLSYTYDNVGNISSITSSNDQITHGLSSEVLNYTYGTLPHAVASLSNGKVYSYDANGNIISDGTRSITYNYDNMPTLIGNVGFTYDGTGTRVMKSSPSGNTVYVDKLNELVNGVRAKYIFAGDKRVARKEADLVLYYHPDHLGSTSFVTDATGAIAEEISYLPFGETKQDSGILSLSHKFTSQEKDSETGLYNYNARTYDPDLGRFLTPDTIVPDPENPQSLNRYSYVLNNPLMYTDPSGHSFWTDVGKFFKRILDSLCSDGCGAGVDSNGNGYAYGGSSNNSGSGGGGKGGSSGGGSNGGSGVAADSQYSFYFDNMYLSGGAAVFKINSVEYNSTLPPSAFSGGGINANSGGKSSAPQTNLPHQQNSWVPSFNFNQFANEVRDNRFDLSATLGTLTYTLGFGTMPKTAEELRGFSVPKDKLNPWTNQLSRLTERTGDRTFREFGRTGARKLFGGLSTGLTVVEGFYDWWIIGRAAVNATTW